MPHLIYTLDHFPNISNGMIVEEISHKQILVASVFIDGIEMQNPQGTGKIFKKSIEEINLRKAQIKFALIENNGFWGLNPKVKDQDGTEINYHSYFLGMVQASVMASKYGFRRLVHLDSFMKLATYPKKPRKESRPDLVGYFNRVHSSNSLMYSPRGVVECKGISGNSQTSAKRKLQEALQQLNKPQVKPLQQWESILAAPHPAGSPRVSRRIASCSYFPNGIWANYSIDPEKNEPSGELSFEDKVFEGLVDLVAVLPVYALLRDLQEQESGMTINLKDMIFGSISGLDLILGMSSDLFDEIKKLENKKESIKNSDMLDLARLVSENFSSYEPIPHDSKELLEFYRLNSHNTEPLNYKQEHTKNHLNIYGLAYIDYII